MVLHHDDEDRLQAVRIVRVAVAAAAAAVTVARGVAGGVHFVRAVGKGAAVRSVAPVVAGELTVRNPTGAAPAGTEKER